MLSAPRPVAATSFLSPRINVHKLALVVLLLAPTLAAQDVVPRWLTNSPGSGNTNWPFGLATQNRVQYLYEASETGLTAARSITAFEVRAEQGVASVAKSNIDLRIEMSQTPTTMATLNATFATNRGTNHTVVFARRLVSLPATTSQILGAWSPPFVLDAPFSYDATTGESLLIEYDVASQPAGTWLVDCAWSATGVHTALGTGCNGVGSTSSGGQIGGNLLIGVNGGAANAPGALFIGVVEWPVPIPVPGSPGCFSFSSLDVVLPVTLSATGTFSFSLPVPNQQNLLGGPIHGQYAVVSGTPTIDTSPSRRIFITDLDQIGRVYNNTSNTSLTGTVQTRVALVTRLQ